MSKQDRVHLTRSMVDKIEKPATGKIFVWDDDPVGLGVCVTSANGRTYVIDYYTREGTRRRLTLGKVDRLNLDQARIDARKKLSSADLGGDPAEERRAGRRKEKMGDLLDDYIAKVMPARKRASTIRVHKAQIEKHIRPALGAMAIADVTKKDIRELHLEVSTPKLIAPTKAKTGKSKKNVKPAYTGGPIAANRVISLLSAIMAYAIEQECRADNPCKGITRHQEAGRRRYFNEVELAAIAHELAVSPAQDGCDVIRLCMLTGCRVGEALKAQFHNFLLGKEDGVWTKPAITTKQKREHQIPLSSPAVELVNRRRRLVNHGDWLFPARWMDDGHMTTIRALWAGICKRAGLKNARVHDLRHTYASLLVSGGHSLPVIGALLGHADSKTTQRYAHLFDEPLRAATNSIGEALKAATSPLKTP